LPNAFSNIGSGVQQGSIASLYGSTPGKTVAQTPAPQTYTPTTPVKSITQPNGSTVTFQNTPTTSGALKTSSAPSATTSNVDNVNKTYEYGGQKYAMDPNTGRYELASSIQSGTNPGMISSSPLNTQTTTPQAPVQQPTYTPSQGLQGQIISGLANMSTQPSQAYLDAQAEANRINQQMTEAKKQFAQQTNDINTSGTWTSRALGQQGQANIQNASTLAALGSQYQAATAQTGQALTQQQQQIGALQGAGSLNAPQFPSYGTQVYDPATGTFKTGTGGTLDSAVSAVAEKVRNGQMTYADAQNALSGYGQGGSNALIQALGNNFNVAQSNTLASQQGSIGPALQYANSAVANLQSALSGLGYLQSTNVPIINQLTQYVSEKTGQFSSDSVQKYKNAIAEARNAMQIVLASTRGGTPTDYVGQSNTLLPDNATPNQVKAAIETLQSLGTAKAGIYQNPGAAGNSGGGTVTAGGYTYKQDANGNWVVAK